MMLLLLFILAITTISTVVEVVDAQQHTWEDTYRLDFTYDLSASNGPLNWDNVEGVGEWQDGYYDGSTAVEQQGNQCMDSNRPSPIVLNDNQQYACPDLHEPLSRQIYPFADCGRDQMIFAITPYALKGYFPHRNSGLCRPPWLQVSGRLDPYVMMWMEVHARAEHVVGGKHYDAEIQMVHGGTGDYTGQLMTISLLVDATSLEDDVEFEWLLQQWQEVSRREASACSNRQRNLQNDLSEYQANLDISSSPQSSYDNIQLNNNKTNVARNLQYGASPCRTDQFGRGCEPYGPRRRMFPYNLWQSIWYYGYYGSLTAPPCSGIVEWRILDEPLKISKRQYKILTSLLTQSRNENCELDTATDHKGENRRPIQVGANPSMQGVFHCTPNDFGYFAFPPNEQ